LRICDAAVCDAADAAVCDTATPCRIPPSGVYILKSSLSVVVLYGECTRALTFENDECVPESVLWTKRALLLHTTQPSM